MKMPPPKRRMMDRREPPPPPMNHPANMMGMMGDAIVYPEHMPHTGLGNIAAILAARSRRAKASKK